MNANGSSLGNTADGTFALQGCTSCSNNVGVGYYALSEMSTATNNTGVGAFAVQINNASNNTGVGYGALSASPDLTILKSAPTHLYDRKKAIPWQ